MKHLKRLRSGSDIRGTATLTQGQAVTLDRSVAERVGFVFALWLAERLGTTPDKLTVAVGRDPRPSGEALKQAVIHGLTTADADVYDFGLCTTPGMFMSTLLPETYADGAIMVTASRHGWNQNGFKLITREGGLHAEDIDEILRRAEAVTLPQRLVTELDFLSMYKESLKERVKKWLDDDVQCPLLGLHIIVDAGSGAGGFYADLLEELGAEVTGSLNLASDRSFPDRMPDPEDPSSVAALSKAVIENEADLGVLFDADCDRAAVVDETGRAINRNRLIALIAAILLEDHPGATFVTDSVTSSGLNRFITEWGGVHYRYKRGYRNVIDEAIRLNEEGIDCPLAIETSGHAAFRENHFIDDGMYLVTRLVCEAMNRKREGLTLCSLIDELQEPVESVEIRMPLLSEDIREAGQSVIETVLSHTLSNPGWHLATDNREGVRILFDQDGGVQNAWINLRLSVHDPVMPLNAESDAPGGVTRMLKELYALLEGREELDLEPLRAAIAPGDQITNVLKGVNHHEQE